MGSEPQYPRGLCGQTGSCFCLSFCTLLLLLPNPYSPLPRLGERWDVQNMMIQSRPPHSQLSFAHQQIWKEKLESGVKAAFSVPGPVGLFFMRPIVMVDVVGQAAASVLIQSLHSCCSAFCCLLCLHSCVCVTWWINFQVICAPMPLLMFACLHMVFLRMYVCVCKCACVFVCPGQRS